MKEHCSGLIAMEGIHEVNSQSVIMHKSPGDCSGVGGLYGGGGEKGGAPGQGLEVPGPHKAGLLPKLK